MKWLFWIIVFIVTGWLFVTAFNLANNLIDDIKASDSYRIFERLD